ncbi:hypothetical protein QMK19_01775 [Streptomyces sp. H10-C2]|uniref:hypothetical protein n=1 Tax=unclassified Streptomyces TaxID=2593676 RepID=UPI0024B93A94|nr:MULTISPECIES: hypothetical protein [unclassified Streptomyces]MDJ0342103.1 hypothetical protein [Streptomyces sp. PH10-H1]MDJ0368445.1 hypothetical protein [Streptomyces sp. H10-C2]
MRLNGPGQLDRLRPVPRPAPRPGPLPRPHSRHRLGLRLPLAAVLAAGLPLLLAADATASPWPSWSPPAGDHLTVTVNDGAGKVTTHDLYCGAEPAVPAGTAESTATSPKASAGASTEPSTGESTAAACDRLARLGGPVGPVPPGQMCSMIYGGPQTAQVTGVSQGLTVNERYSRANGCEVARWKEMAPVLPPVGGGA